MKIVGDSIQEGIPTPENPKEIKYEPKIVVHTIDGKEMMIPIKEELKEGDFIFKSQKDNKWYIRRKKQMDEEEKEAIAYLKREYEKLIKEDNILFPLYKSDAKRLINLIDKQNKVIDEIRCEFLKYDWENSNNKQVYNQLKSLYNAIFRKVEEDEQNCDIYQIINNDGVGFYIDKDTIGQYTRTKR